jgi:hypothetical protein
LVTSVVGQTTAVLTRQRVWANQILQLIVVSSGGIALNMGQNITEFTLTWVP